MKVKVKTSLKFEEQKICYEGFGIFSDSKLQFIENDVKVFLNFKEQLMVRQDLVKKLSYKFVENEETLNEVLVFPENIGIFLKIFTKRFDYQNSCCEICYRLLDEEKDVVYRICWEVVK